MTGLPTSFDIYIEANGQRVAVVQSYQAEPREDGRYTVHLDRVHPVCGALKDGVHELDDFSLVVCKPDRKIVYSGCRWSEIHDTGTLGDMATERVVMIAKEGGHPMKFRDPSQNIGCIKFLWDNPMTGRKWCQCGHCGGVVSWKADTCRHCGAHFQNMKDGKLVLR